MKGAMARRMTCYLRQVYS